MASSLCNWPTGFGPTVGRLTIVFDMPAGAAANVVAEIQPVNSRLVAYTPTVFLFIMMVLSFPDGSDKARTREGTTGLASPE